MQEDLESSLSAGMWCWSQILALGVSCTVKPLEFFILNASTKQARKLSLWMPIHTFAVVQILIDFVT
jgi:hypothetical protein